MKVLLMSKADRNHSHEVGTRAEVTVCKIVREIEKWAVGYDGYESESTHQEGVAEKCRTAHSDTRMIQ